MERGNQRREEVDGSLERFRTVFLLMSDLVFTLLTKGHRRTLAWKQRGISPGHGVEIEIVSICKYIILLKPV
jgi:hypothetical protein